MNFLNLIVQYLNFQYPYLILNEVDDTEYIVAV